MRHNKRNGSQSSSEFFIGDIRTGAPLLTFTPERACQPPIPNERRGIAIDTHEKVVEDYLNQADWIGDSHPLAHSLRQVAEKLDENHTITWRREFNSLMRTIEAMKPEQKTEEPKVDPLLSPRRNGA